jgi:hypothetical protein
MERYAPEAVDLGKESAETKRLYGLGPPGAFRKLCLVARRLVEGRFASSSSVAYINSN